MLKSVLSLPPSLPPGSCLQPSPSHPLSILPLVFYRLHDRKLYVYKCLSKRLPTIPSKSPLPPACSKPFFDLFSNRRRDHQDALVEEGGGKYVIIPFAFVENSVCHLKRGGPKDGLGLWR